MASMVRVSPAPDVLAELLETPLSVSVGGQFMPLDDALRDAEYLALCFSASYCPSCRLFMPALEYAYRQGGLEADKSCKVLLVGGDKTAEAFDAYRSKYPQFLSLSFEETQAVKTKLRDLWKISTIPHVVLLERHTARVVQSNVRVQIEGNPRCDGFPWTGVVAGHATTAFREAGSPGGEPRHWTLADRILKKPRCYQLGHLAKEGSTSMYMDEHATRVRAGLLNITSWFAMLNIFYFREVTFLWVLWPVVGWDFVAASAFGLTPLSPYGMLGTLLAYLFGPAEPHWKPAGPKRFAWVIGFFLVNMCAAGYLLQLRALMITAVLMCNVATWAESALGFCVGCWMWNTLVAPRIGQQACQECKM